MFDYNIVNFKTPVVRAKEKNSSIALVSGKPLIFHKVFDINEFIGEELASVRKLKTAHYFPVCLGNVKRCLGSDNIAVKQSKYRVGSYDFKQDGVVYKTSSQLPYYFDRDSFDILLEKCRDDENRKEFLNDYLEMMGLDIFMGQTDRGGNIFYEFHPNGEVCLSPIFDYEASFDDEYFSIAGYVNDFFRCLTIVDYKNLILKYPELEGMLKSYEDVCLEEVIVKMAKERGFVLNDFDIDPYKKFDEASHKRLEKILK